MELLPPVQLVIVHLRGPGHSFLKTNIICMCVRVCPDKRNPGLLDVQSSGPLQRHCSFADDLELESERESELTPVTSVSQ